MVGIPQLREAGWLITGDDRDPVRHLFIRLEETMDGSGVWTLELADCRRRASDGGHVMHRYSCEANARTATVAIYALSRHLAPLPIWDPDRREQARWRVKVYSPEPIGVRRERPVTSCGELAATQISSSSKPSNSSAR
ncbi:hypothetical protein AB0M46_41225 [Dactylosporangium sp. NPDC051485]|uniref:hypothetical protein n=1 Tax=Dactylosporangium sp. NPDC051485 TaxID=3154846 RepID=UPI0034419059